METDTPSAETKWKPKFLSEFSMGALDFLRYNEWLKYVEHWSAMLNSTEEPTLEMIQHYFAGLNVLYKSWRELVADPTKIKNLDDRIKEAKEKKRIWERSDKAGQPINPVIVNKLIDILDEFHTELMSIKQILGLGIVVKRQRSPAERIKMGMRGGDLKNLNLPDV